MFFSSLFSCPPTGYYIVLVWWAVSCNYGVITVSITCIHVWWEDRLQRCHLTIWDGPASWNFRVFVLEACIWISLLGFGYPCFSPTGGPLSICVDRERTCVGLTCLRSLSVWGRGRGGGGGVRQSVGHARMKSRVSEVQQHVGGRMTATVPLWVQPPNSWGSEVRGQSGALPGGIPLRPVHRLIDRGWRFFLSREGNDEC